MNELVTLKKIEQSKLAIREVKSLDEIKKIIDQGEALKAYAKSAKMSAEIQADIAELNLIAERRLGEISVAMKKAKVKRKDSEYRTSVIGEKKTAALSKAGIDIRRANEAEKLANIDEGVFNDLLKTAREKNIPKTDIEKIAKMDKEKQRAVTDKIAAGEAKSVKEADRKVKQKETIQRLTEAGKVKDINGVLYEGDVFEQISKIPDKSIDLLFADPPYMILDEKWDSFESKENFLDFTHAWMYAAFQKVKDTGRIYLCFSQYYQYDLYDLLRKMYFYGFNFGQTIIWHYRNNNKHSDRKLYRFSYEPIFYLYGKNAGELNFQAETYGEAQFNVWTIATPQSNFQEGKFHPSQKPLELLDRIIMTGSKEGDTVLDPFAGSGTTGLAAKKLGRKYILIEKDKDYCEIARGRLNGMD